MPLAEILSSKFNICPQRFASRPNIHFWTNVHFSLGRGHYQMTYQLPEGVYLLIISRERQQNLRYIINETAKPLEQSLLRLCLLTTLVCSLPRYKISNLMALSWMDGKLTLTCDIMHSFQYKHVLYMD